MGHCWEAGGREEEMKEQDQEGQDVIFVASICD
jgi:hypothetical protein